MLEPVISGILLGWLVAVLAGPVFFLIMNVSLHKGFVYAVYIAVGVLLSDAFYIFIAYFGSNFILLLSEHRFWAGIGSALLLAGFGIALLAKKNNIPVEAITLQEKLTAPYVFVLKGFMINAMNPSVLFFWIGVAGTVSVKETYTVNHLVIFYSSILATIFSTDLLKAYIAHRIKKYLTQYVLQMLNRICGFALLGFAIYTFVKAVMQGIG